MIVGFLSNKLTLRVTEIAIVNLQIQLQNHFVLKNLS